MIVGGYSLHLYCDDQQHQQCIETQFQNHQFAGPTKTEALKEAKAAGWSVYQKADIAICPHCNKRRFGSK